MPIAGADLTELSGLVTRLAGQDRQALTAALDKMNAVVQDSATWWIGEYADRFRRDFAGFVTTTHRGLDRMLLQAALVTRQNLGVIASATGDGPWQQGPANGGQLVLAAVPGQSGFAAPAGSAFAADSGTELIKDGLELGFLEERIDTRGLHYFTLRTAGQAVETVARLADPDRQAPSAGPALGEPVTAIPDDITQALRELGPGVTRIDAYHSRPAGTRRVQVSVLVRPGAACVVMSAFGVAPDKPQLFEVNGEGLRHVVRDALCDPGGDLRSDVTREAGPPYRCPVCGYLGLSEPPRTEESGASYEICPSCGMKWWSRRLRPAGWDPQAQLRELGESGP